MKTLLQGGAATGAPATGSGPAPGLRRLRKGRGFSYIDEATGEPASPRARERIRGLAIPPAWVDVWICRDAKGDLQATGRDSRGRKQYLYHSAFRAARADEKYARMLEFGHALQRIRTGVSRDLRRRGLPRERILAAVVGLLDETAVRVGNDEYARQNGTAGLTTLRQSDVEIGSSKVVLDFVGKGGKRHTIALNDPRIARVLAQSSDLAGDGVFTWTNGDSVPHRVTSGQVNEYIREISGSECTAKDFRTWHGSVTAAEALADEPVPASEREAARAVNAALKVVAGKLGNTPAVCRESYFHPYVLEAFRSGLLQRGWTIHRARWRRQAGQPAERLLLWLLGGHSTKGGSEGVCAEEDPQP